MMHGAYNVKYLRRLSGGPLLLQGIFEVGSREIGCEGLSGTDKRQGLVSNIFVNIKTRMGSEKKHRIS